MVQALLRMGKNVAGTRNNSQGATPIYLASTMKMADTNEKKAIFDGLIELFGQYRRWLLFFRYGYVPVH